MPISFPRLIDRGTFITGSSLKASITMAEPSVYTESGICPGVSVPRKNLGYSVSAIFRESCDGVSKPYYEHSISMSHPSGVSSTILGDSGLSYEEVNVVNHGVFSSSGFINRGPRYLKNELRSGLYEFEATYSYKPVKDQCGQPVGMRGSLTIRKNGFDPDTCEVLDLGVESYSFYQDSSLTGLAAAMTATKELPIIVEYHSNPIISVAATNVRDIWMDLIGNDVTL